MSHQKSLQMGLGQAIKQLVTVEFARRMGYHHLPEAALREQDMLIQALDHYVLPLMVDCDDTDEAEPAISIEQPRFTQAAETSCCRIVRSTEDAANPRTAHSVESDNQISVVRSSRR